MKYVPIPIAMLEVGRPLPIDIWSDTGQLLLKKGQPVVSEQHRDKLHAFNASSTPGDAMAWQRAYERMVHEMLRDGVDVRNHCQSAHALPHPRGGLCGGHPAERRLAGFAGRAARHPVPRRFGHQPASPPRRHCPQRAQIAGG